MSEMASDNFARSVHQPQMALDDAALRPALSPNGRAAAGVSPAAAASIAIAGAPSLADFNEAIAHADLAIMELRGELRAAKRDREDLGRRRKEAFPELRGLMTAIRNRERWANPQRHAEITEKMRGPRGCQNVRRLKAIVRLRKQGLSHALIAESLGIRTNNVAYALKRWGDLADAHSSRPSP